MTHRLDPRQRILDLDLLVQSNFPSIPSKSRYIRASPENVPRCFKKFDSSLSVNFLCEQCIPVEHNVITISWRCFGGPPRAHVDSQIARDVEEIGKGKETLLS